MNRAERRHALVDGEARIDPLVRIGVLVREAFGNAEGEEILIESLRRLPRPKWPLHPDGAHESDYVEAVRLVIIDRHPELAKHYPPFTLDGMPGSETDSGS